MMADVVELINDIRKNFRDNFKKDRKFKNSQCKMLERFGPDVLLFQPTGSGKF